METIALGSTGQETTRLGFGCSSVMGSLGRKDSLTMLETAFDAGIRHFDVAPSYGFGEAEACVGEFLARHRGDVTVTTKFGIAPAPTQSLKSVARTIARPVLKAFPGLKKKVAAAASAAVLRGADTEKTREVTQFTPEKARESLLRSLNALRVERIDLWLLHEATATDLSDERLLRLLEDLAYAGTIGSFGVGSEAAKIPFLLAERPGYCGTLQYEWSVLDPLIAPGEAFRVHHRSLTDNFWLLREALGADPARRRRWSDHCDADLSDAETLSQLMLKAALVCNPASIILFSSKQPRHIRHNARVVDDVVLEEKALRLYSLVRAEAVATPAFMEVEALP